MTTIFVVAMNQLQFEKEERSPGSGTQSSMWLTHVESLTLSRPESTTNIEFGLYLDRGNLIWRVEADPSLDFNEAEAAA